MGLDVSRQRLRVMNRRSRGLDSDHITSLSYDATPVIAAHLHLLQGEELNQIARVLRQQQLSLTREVETRPWQAYHPAIQRAYESLLPHEELLKQYPTGRQS
ncbi:MAG: hypothetical protein ACKVVP_19485 [Chloroflexota bacterium]